MKKLFLVRHAKASLEDPDVLDVQRKITEEGKYLAVLFQGENNTQKCEVFNQSAPSFL